MKYLHTMLRVLDLEKSLKFYTDGLGFKIIKRTDYAKDKFTLVFLRADEENEDGPALELTHNWETKGYTRGDAYGHMAYAVESIDQVKQRLQNNGYDLSWGPGKSPNGLRQIAFVDDPDGYEIELIEG
jgi:lactoylglutathione lyase